MVEAVFVEHLELDARLLVQAKLPETLKRGFAVVVGADHVVQRAVQLQAHGFVGIAGGCRRGGKHRACTPTVVFDEVCVRSTLGPNSIPCRLAHACGISGVVVLPWPENTKISCLALEWRCDGVEVFACVACHR